MKFIPTIYGKDEITELIKFCSSQIEKWQIPNCLDDAFEKIENNIGKKFIFSNSFNFLQQLRIILTDNSDLFRDREDKFKEIDNWILSKMSAKVILIGVKPLKLIARKRESRGPNNASDLIGDNFLDCLTEDGKKVYPYLFETYSNTRPSTIGYMLFALKDLDILIDGSLHNNQTQLHKRLCCSFGKIGSRQALSTRIAAFETANQFNQEQIDLHRNKIKAAAKNLK